MEWISCWNYEVAPGDASVNFIELNLHIYSDAAHSLESGTNKGEIEVIAR